MLGKPLEKVTEWYFHPDSSREPTLLIAQGCPGQTGQAKNSFRLNYSLRFQINPPEPDHKSATILSKQLPAPTSRASSVDDSSPYHAK